MFKSMFNKSLSVAGVFCALAMNVNTALGFDISDERLEVLYAKHKSIMSKVKELDIPATQAVIQEICPCSNDPEDIIRTFVLVCLGLNKEELAKYSPEARMRIFEELEENFDITMRSLPDALGQPSSKGTYQPRFRKNNLFQPLSMLIEFTDLVSAAQLDHERIGDSELESLVEALFTNSSLTELNLEHNRIEDSGTESLAGALLVNSSLTELNLCSNLIGESGAASLAEALKENSYLTELNLESNNIRESGAKSLSDALKVNSSLTELNLKANRIGASGIESLAQGLENNSTATELHL